MSIDPDKATYRKQFLKANSDSATPPEKAEPDPYAPVELPEN